MSSPLSSHPRVSEFLPAPDEARVFWRMRRRMLLTLASQAFLRARFRLTLILALSLLLWLGLFALFAEGFHLMDTGIRDRGLFNETVGAVFGMFFAALMLMLLFSSGIILYGSLFRSREVAFLLTIPARAGRVFLHKFQEAILLSSWGFLLLGSPMLLAYGLAVAAPWYYYAMLLPMMVAFVYIPGAVGAMLCLAIIRWLPGRRRAVLIVAVVVLVGMGIWVAWSLLAGPRSNTFTPAWFQEVLARLKISEKRLLPSWWLSTGLLEASQRNVRWEEGVKFLVLMVANALFCRQLAIWMASGVYRRAYSALFGRQSGRKRTRVSWIDRLLLGAAVFLPPQIRLLMVKDLRLFRRDPMQWSQFLIFFGLLGLYFVNIRTFRYDSSYYVEWVNLVSFLNLSVVGLLLSTFTTRFIFPMISLEGRRFWILGLIPVRRETILWSKFLFAAGGSIVPCSVLILLSDIMLGMAHASPMVLASHQLTCLILCIGLSGIAVGLGARLPNLREQSPSRIAAGFGGTLNLVISTLYIILVVLLTALPCHFYLVAKHTQTARILSGQSSLYWWIEFWLIAGTAASILLGILATVIPMRLGFRAFRRLEF